MRCRAGLCGAEPGCAVPCRAVPGYAASSQAEPGAAPAAVRGSLCLVAGELTREAAGTKPGAASFQRVLVCGFEDVFPLGS